MNGGIVEGSLSGELYVQRGCGLDIHKKTVVACIMGDGLKKEIQTFSTFTDELLELKKWLKSNGITHVAMESTGIYWKPIFNILEDSFQLFLVNARHIKHVPGRKTDVLDSEWICKLLRAGLLRGSFIPPRDIRELRDLTRYERKLVQAISAEKNRIQKVLEDANIKLSSVVSDMSGVSATQMIEELIEGSLSPDELAELARGRLKSKKVEIARSLRGNFTDHHKFMIESSLSHINYLEVIINKLEERISELLKHYQEEYELLQTIPGVKEKGAASIISEIGVKPDKNFPSPEHISSWAGIAPGNNESAGKKKSGKTTKGNKNLKATLTESAWAASRKKDCYLRSKYNSLVGRRGKKRTLIAIGHKILISAYYILKDKVPYNELGSNYLDLRKVNKVRNNLVKRLERLGYNVNLEVATV